MIVSNKMWTTLFPLSVDHRQGHRSSNEPLFLRKSSLFSEVRNLEEDLGTGSQMKRGIRESPLFRCLLSRNSKRCSREETSTLRGEADPRNSHFEEDREGFLGRVGFDLRGSLVMDLPSISEIRGKRLIFEGICETPGVENMEVCLPFPSQPPKSSSFPSCSLELPLPSPSGPHLLSSVSLSQSPRENQVTFEIFSKKGIVGTFYQKYVGILVRDEEENQCALSNQLSESFTPRKSKPSSPKEDSNLLSGS